MAAHDHNQVQAFASELTERSNSQCELCANATDLAVLAVPPSVEITAENCVLICTECREQLAHNVLNSNHWRCLQESP